MNTATAVMAGALLAFQSRRTLLDECGQVGGLPGLLEPRQLRRTRTDAGSKVRLVHGRATIVRLPTPLAAPFHRRDYVGDSVAYSSRRERRPRFGHRGRRATPTVRRGAPMLRMRIDRHLFFCS